MKLLVLISSLIVASTARPEPPRGYNYPSPKFQSVQHSFTSGQIQTPAYQFPITTFGNGDLGNEIFSNFDSGSYDDYSSGPAVIQSGPATVHKHVYVHVAPEEPEEVRPRNPVVVSAPQKHYKIIFIKAPSPPKPALPVIPVQPQNEEKTLVYVLVKKPEEAPEINIPAPAPTQPSKPEVYFIKYGTKKEQTAQVEENISNGNILGQETGILNNGQSEISTSFGSTGGASFDPSIEQSSKTIGGNHNQLAASVGLTNSATRYGPPGHK
ncbi:uncharacterized protein LOC130449871 [Diorhabda sublineata]|uniref:uncharacterized protein LOC130449871 n=1 Tax=Diorhabda sublineata TaxID=1163346 RepID=UPI0024E09F8C|nr:uncharacterized protein LOC130449871 [Diorhabda sublineata]